MEAERLATADRTLVPNRFVVHLNPDDLEGFGDMTGVTRVGARRRRARLRPSPPLHAGRPTPGDALLRPERGTDRHPV
jgi:hypothetical protein